MDPRAVDHVRPAVAERRRVSRFAIEQAGRARHHPLGQQVDDVHPEAVDPAVEPPVHHPVHLGADLRVLPVQLGLLGAEQVQVVLTRLCVEGPRRPPNAEPQLVGSAPGSPASWPSRGGRHQYQSRFGLLGARPRLDEPLVLVAGVVDDQVHEHLEAGGVRLLDQLVELVQGPEQRVDVLVVADVVAVVVHRRAVDRAQPDHVHAQPDEVVEVGDDPAEVTDAVAVGVREAPRVDLVDDGRLPPVPLHASTLVTRWSSVSRPPQRSWVGPSPGCGVSRRSLERPPQPPVVEEGALAPVSKPPGSLRTRSKAGTAPRSGGRRGRPWVRRAPRCAGRSHP